MNDAFLELKVSKTYEGSFHLEVDAAFPRGVTAIFGPSGSGKTTILSMIGGFVEPTEGTVHIDGVDVTTVPPARRPTVTVFQDYALFPHMTV